MEPQKLREASDLRESLHKRDTQFNTLTRLAALISQSENLEKVFGGVLDQLLDLTGGDIGSIHVLETDSRCLKLITSRGVSLGFFCAAHRIPLGECLCGQAAQMGELAFSTDLAADPRVSRAACGAEGFGSLVSIPLKSRDRVLGLMTLYAKRAHAFSEMDQELLILVGHQIGVAIENAQLYARTRELAVLEERGLIAQEIHDGIAQSLAYLNLETKRLEELLTTKHKKQAFSQLDHIREVIKNTYGDVCELLVDFRVKFKEGEGLVEVLSRYIRDFSQRTGIRADFVNADSALALSPFAQVQVFRIVQEALSNVRKHASAQRVTVALSATPTFLEVKVQDDGRGFDPQEISGRGHLHLGLEIMRERAANLHGDLRLESHLGRGTTLHITIPLKPTKE